MFLAYLHLQQLNILSKITEFIFSSIDTKELGTGIMDENRKIDDILVERRELQMEDIEQLIEDSSNERIKMVYE